MQLQLPSLACFMLSEVIAWGLAEVGGGCRPRLFDTMVRTQTQTIVPQPNFPRSSHGNFSLVIKIRLTMLTLDVVGWDAHH